MKDAMTYKGYSGLVHYSAEDEIFYGKIDAIISAGSSLYSCESSR